MKLRSKRLLVPTQKSEKHPAKKKPPKSGVGPAQAPTVQVVSQTEPTNRNLKNKNDAAEELIRQLFENVDSSGAYKRAIDAFIRRNDVYSKFKPTRRRFSRRKTVVHGPFNTYQMDLSDYRSIRHSNGNYGWMLFIIDAFSRFGYVIPLKHKTATETHDALNQWLLSLNHLPKFIYSDGGKEFTNGAVQDLLKTRGITHYVLSGVHKASIVERFQRTIKTSLEMYFYAKKKKRWLDIIQKLIQSYNNRFNRTIKMAPAKISYSNFESVYKELYPKNTSKRLCRLHKGDLVRVAIKKSDFSKGYHQTFSTEIYKIIKLVNYNGVCVYTVSNIEGGPLLKKYYNELSIVLKNDNNST